MGGWIGVDLDGTLAHYAGWVDENHIGEPIPKMLGRVRQWLTEGRDVRIFTARGEESHEAIRRWCVLHLRKILPITSTKDFHMVELWDDRAVQVIPNTGERADGRT